MSGGFGGPWLWLLLAAYGLGFLLLSPRASDAGGFFRGTDRRGRTPSAPALFASVFIAWIFAKSVTNAANLGAELGLPGAVAYAGYWAGIPVAAVVILALRARFGATSLPEWLARRYGPAAAATFLLAVLIRLYNEVWSNTAVVGSYFGERGSAAYWGAALLFTAFTLAYSMKGGLRASIWTDAVQAVLFGGILFLVLGLLLGGGAGSGAVAPPGGVGEGGLGGAPADAGEGAGGIGALLAAGSWTLAGGVDLLLVALLQSLSYPFHDPVLTDRGFLSGRRATLKAFLAAGAAGAAAIALFGLLGVPLFLGGVVADDDAPRIVAASLGGGLLLLVSALMMTSAGSTLDSTFASVAKAATLDAPGVRKGGRERGPANPARGVRWGRAAMVAAAVLGTIPLFTGAAILTATTISGTMVLGLAPVFVLGLVLDAPPLSFHLAFWTGILAGVAEVAGRVPDALAIGDGPYATLLGANAWGLAAATALYLLPWGWIRLRSTERAAW